MFLFLIKSLTLKCVVVWWIINIHMLITVNFFFSNIFYSILNIKSYICVFFLHDIPNFIIMTKPVMFQLLVAPGGVKSAEKKPLHPPFKGNCNARRSIHTHYTYTGCPRKMCFSQYTSIYCVYSIGLLAAFWRQTKLS